MDRRGLSNNLASIIVTIFIPVALSALISLAVDNKPLIWGINLGLAAALGVIKLTGILPRLVFTHNKRYVARHIGKALRRLKKLARSYHSPDYTYALTRLKNLVSAEEFFTVLKSLEKDEPREDKKYYFRQKIIEEELHAKS
ncbi:MAG: hypothetical protein LBQ35_01905 [Spirochaetaceae bacterium]|jgi:hypothetical protein|nr:hypothetical protein [Spirochaetaceae bacterium]